MLPLKKCKICGQNHRLISAFKRCARRNLPLPTWELKDIGLKAKSKKRRKSDIPKIRG